MKMGSKTSGGNGAINETRKIITSIPRPCIGIQPLSDKVSDSSTISCLWKGALPHSAEFLQLVKTEAIKILFIFHNLQNWDIANNSVYRIISCGSGTREFHLLFS